MNDALQQIRNHANLYAMTDSTVIDPYAEHLSEKPLDLAKLLAETEDSASGGLAVFGGTVRDHHGGKGVHRLRYSAYAPLAAKRIAELEKTALRRFEVQHCRIVHRIGELAIGDTAIYVVVRSAHREAAFEAARWAIDTVKSTVPIWKEEYYDDGSSDHVLGTPLKDVPE